MLSPTRSRRPPARSPLSYGSFQLNADGSYTYTLNNANPAVTR